VQGISDEKWEKDIDITNFVRLYFFIRIVAYWFKLRRCTCPCGFELYYSNNKDKIKLQTSEVSKTSEVYFLFIT